MSDVLKDCPFCKQAVEICRIADEYVYHSDNGCLLSSDVFYLDDWQKRPIEEALRVEIEDAMKVGTRDGMLVIKYYRQILEIKRLLAANPDTIEAYQYIVSEISDVVNGGEG